MKFKIGDEVYSSRFNITGKVLKTYEYGGISQLIQISYKNNTKRHYFSRDFQLLKTKEYNEDFEALLEDTK